MSLYRNEGAPIPREDGSVVEHGETFEPTEGERRTLAYKIVAVGEPEHEPEPDPLSGVDFASPEARELAEGEGLVAEDFDNRLGTGQGNGWLKSDVKNLLEDS